MTLTVYQQTKEYLKIHPSKWLVTGVSGFIGSNLLEELLKLNQEVVGLDNFSTGFKQNLQDIENMFLACNGRDSLFWRVIF